MNIFFFELKQNKKSAIIWIISILLTGLLLISFYPVIRDEFVTFQNFFNSLPEALRNIPGMDFTESARTLLGYYSSFPFTYISLIMAVQAILLGINVLGKEIKTKSTDFLYTRPKSRNKIILEKIAASVFILIVTNIVLVFGFVGILLMFNEGGFDYKIFSLITVSLFFIQLVFLSFGFIAASTLKIIKTPISISLAIVFTFLGINSFADDKLDAFVPFRYFDNLDLVKGGSYDFGNMLIIFGIFLGSILLALYKFNKKELNA